MNFDVLEQFFAHERAPKSRLAVGLAFTRLAINNGLPIDPNNLETDAGGQIALLGKGPVQAILADYGINRLLASECGRTTRGNLQRARRYVNLLNSENYTPEELKQVEEFWIGKVQAFFAGAPFQLCFDPSKSVRAAIRDLITRAEERQKQTPGTTIVGTILQHLVGAKLMVILPDPPEMHGANAADQQTDRAGDFVCDDVVIHVTNAPGELLMRKCLSNIEGGYRPIIITTARKLISAATLAENFELEDRIDFFDIEQFLSGNVYEVGHFEASKRKETLIEIINRYNDLIDRFETDPSLKIAIGDGRGRR